MGANLVDVMHFSHLPPIDGVGPSDMIGIDLIKVIEDADEEKDDLKNEDEQSEDDEEEEEDDLDGEAGEGEKEDTLEQGK